MNDNEKIIIQKVKELFDILHFNTYFSEAWNTICGKAEPSQPNAADNAYLTIRAIATMEA